MGFECQQCEKSFTNKYNLKRHIERQHDSWSDTVEQYDDKNTESESEKEDDKEESSDDSDISESGESQSSDQSETTNSYTYEEVRAILRYFLQSDES